MIQYNGKDIEPTLNGKNLTAVMYNGNMIYPDEATVTFTVATKDVATYTFEPKVGDFVYSDHTWSSIYNKEKTCVGVIAIVRGLEFDFCALEDVDLAGTVYGSFTELIASDDEIEYSSTIMTHFDEVNGRKKTRLLLSNVEYNDGDDNGSVSPIADYAIKYSTDGFSAENDYEWFVPTLYHMNAVYINLDAIQDSLAIAGTEFNVDDLYGTSSFSSSGALLKFDLSSGYTTSNFLTSTNVFRLFNTIQWRTIDSGSYIYDNDGNQYTADEWTNSGLTTDDLAGVAVVSTNISGSYLGATNTAFLIAGEPSKGKMCASSYSSSRDYYYQICRVNSSDYYLNDQSGKLSSQAIYNTEGEDGTVITTLVAEGKYLPGIGELRQIANKSDLQDCLDAVGWSIDTTGNTEYASSTAYSDSRFNDLSFDDAFGEGSVTRDYYTTSTSNKPYIPCSTIPYKAEYEGVYICDEDGNFYTANEWSGDNAIGVAVIDKDAQFIIPKMDSVSFMAFLADSTVTSDNIEAVSTYADAVNDINGYYNTQRLIAEWGTDNCQVIAEAQTWTNLYDEIGYIGSFGEWQIANKYYTDIDTCLELIGSTTLTSLAANSSYYFATSTVRSMYTDDNNLTKFWSFNWVEGQTSGYYGTGKRLIVPFFRIMKRTLITNSTISIDDEDTTLIDSTYSIGLRMRNEHVYEITADGYDNYFALITPTERNVAVNVYLNAYDSEQRFYKRWAEAGDYTWLVPDACTSTDAFLVGGGAAGFYRYSYYKSGAAGGYTTTYRGTDYEAPEDGTWDGDWFDGRDGNAFTVTPGEEIALEVGAGGSISSSTTTRSAYTGGTTWFYSSDYSAEGGTTGYSSSTTVVSNAGSGGSGGGGYITAGGNDGGDGCGTGQGHTTRDFGEIWGTINAGGAIGDSGNTGSPDEDYDHYGYSENSGTLNVNAGYGGAAYKTDSTSSVGGDGTVYLRFYRTIDPHVVITDTPVNLGSSCTGRIVIDFEINTLGDGTQYILSAYDSDDNQRTFCVADSVYRYNIDGTTTDTTGEVILQDRTKATVNTTFLQVGYNSHDTEYSELTINTSSSSSVDSNIYLGGNSAYSNTDTELWIYSVRFYDEDNNLIRRYLPNTNNTFWETKTNTLIEVS